MIGYIALTVVAVVVLYGAAVAAAKIESVVKRGTTHPKVVQMTNAFGVAVADTVKAAPSNAPRFAAVALVPAAAFMLFACTIALVCPPQSDFNVSNVAWSSRSTNVFGATSDAVLVRTTGAAVEPGMLYSKARLSGVEYVSLPGFKWAAVGSEGAADIVGGIYVAAIALIATALAVAGIRGCAPRLATAKPALTL